MKTLTRVFVGLVALIALILIQQYFLNYVQHHVVDPGDILNDSNEGRLLGPVGRVITKGENSFTLRTSSSDVEIWGCSKVRKGIYGEFLLIVQEGKLVCKDFEVFENTHIKVIVSFFVAILVFIILIKELKIGKGGIEYA